MAPVKTYTLRGSSQYLATKGVDVSELRMRTLVRQHEIFVNDPNTAKQATGDTEVQTWRVSEKALNDYVKAAEKGTIRTSNGAKAYRINLDASQLELVRQFAAANGIGEPVRANKTYTKKGKPAEDGAIGSDIEQSFGSEGDDDGLFAETDAEPVEA